MVINNVLQLLTITATLAHIHISISVKRNVYIGQVRGRWVVVIVIRFTQAVKYVPTMNSDQPPYIECTEQARICHVVSTKYGW